MKKNKILLIIIIILIVLILIGIIITLYLYRISAKEKYVSISVFDTTSEVVEVNNNSIVPNIKYNYPIIIKTNKEGKYKISLNIINDSIDDLEKYLFIEIIFLNDVLYSGNIIDLLNNQISFEYLLIQNKNYEINVKYYLNNDVNDEIQLMESNFDIQIIVNKEG
jgi:ABC-type Na+ efflux pump permease subunit